MECQVCGGFVYWLGKLGRLDWFRCGNCGWEEGREEEGE